ncbi:MAG: hypothetical protein KGQ32_04935, partial [Xanthomonadaceae bacterium]|nr:hypothetical protein [Xanthomonadaceae bacterium]
LYLMAREVYATSPEGDPRTAQAVVQICQRATEIDPNYAEAWALMAIGYRQLREAQGGGSSEGLAAIGRALALDPDLAEAHAVKAQLLQQDDDLAGAAAEAAIALKLDPESYEVNRSCARLDYQLQRFDDTIRFYEKAAALMEADINSAAMLISCYTAVGDAAGTRRAAELTLRRADAILAHDRNNAGVIGYSVDALAALGETERAKTRMERALLMDSGNRNMRYNFACMLVLRLNDKDAALQLLAPLLETVADSFLPYVKADPDLASLRDDPRWVAMVAKAEARLAAAKAAVEPANQTA